MASKGEVVESAEEMSTQVLCSYGYVAYKLEYEDDWKDRLELYNDLESASGEAMEYRSCTKAWNKFINELQHIVSLLEFHCDILLTQFVILKCGAAYNSYEFNIVWVAVGSAILNDQGLQELGETEGVKGVSNPIVYTSNY